MNADLVSTVCYLLASGVLLAALLVQLFRPDRKGEKSLWRSLRDRTKGKQ